MDPAIGSALIGVGGVVLGVVITEAVEFFARGKVAREQAEQARHARELVAAEKLDEGLIEAQSVIELTAAHARREGYRAAEQVWGKAWMAYSPRLRQTELLDRYQAVGTILGDLAFGEDTVATLSRRFAIQAIANARATLGRFMRGDPLPDNAFPTSSELIALLGEGESKGDRGGPLQMWIESHPQPDFHTKPAGESRGGDTPPPRN